MKNREGSRQSNVRNKYEGLTSSNCAKFNFKKPQDSALIVGELAFHITNYRIY